MAKLVEVIKSDLYRHCGDTSLINFLRCLLLVPGFKFVFWFRIANRLKCNKIMYLFPWLILRKYRVKYGFDISGRTKIGLGFYLNHTGGIVISSEAEIGNNVNISHGATIGYSPRGRLKGYPKIGDNVFIGPGAKIFGNIVIGNNTCIGANTVVTRSVPANSCAYGYPVKIIPENDNELLVINKWNIN